MSFEDDPIEVRQIRERDGYIAWQWGDVRSLPEGAVITHTFWMHKGEVYHTDYGVIQRSYSGNISLYDSVYNIHSTYCIDEPKIKGEVLNVEIR